ncbi:unnamed protein product [Arctia plantaginis]|uniref:ZAD domain-containing protein n=1 Tax=Arctia plantaginis TaxID=874455 RepID=A0A8S0ZVL1_ARCPL|nr:unnamed protein product [Arctia plantaginis]
MAKKKAKTKSKQVAKPVPVIDNITNDVIAAAYSAATPPLIPVFLKVCRLCESKDGPFLNIFEADRLTAKKIEDLMPFSVAENDDLPHKICFRCSAKLEELYEFIQKCIKTQQNLRNAVGKIGSFVTKSKMGKKLWEEKLNKSNMSNDDICDALIKKAMEGIKSIPVASSMDKEESVLETKRKTRSKEPVVKNDISEPTSNESDEATLRQVSLEKNDTKPFSNKVTRSSKQGVIETEQLETPIKVETVEAKKSSVSKSKKSDSVQSIKLESSESTTQNYTKASTQNPTPTLNSLSYDYEAPAAVRQTHNEEEKKEHPQKPFNIMDHITMIKVNGVGILFQCKLCNRNFLKLDVVESHSCAKNGVPKVDLPKSVPAPEPPKVPSVKYIKIDSDMKKTLTEKVKLAEKYENEKTEI